MELPQQLIKNKGFIFGDLEDFLNACADLRDFDQAETERLWNLGLPPVTSKESLSVMVGFNPGFVHSMGRSAKAHYRTFEIIKGRKRREIQAPKVGVKIIQTWISWHFASKFKAPQTVFGFVPGRNHIEAAATHLNADWVCSVDIEDFFPSVDTSRVQAALKSLGYTKERSIETLLSICAFREALIQGAPTSPVISNIVLSGLDRALYQYADKHGLRLSRYADDIVLSGKGAYSQGTLEDLRALVEADGWKVSERKLEISERPNRLKVHGLLVHGDHVRLTKGYRNRIRAFRHLLATGRIRNDDLPRVLGHLNYADQVDKMNKTNNYRKN